MMKTQVEKITTIVGGTLALVALSTIVYVLGHKPDIVTKPCWRSCHLADGRCKKEFDTAAQANWQSVKQFVCHGEVCNSYQVGDKYYTGHSRYAWVRSVNPLNLFK